MEWGQLSIFFAVRGHRAFHDFQVATKDSPAAWHLPFAAAQQSLF
jgi:hypothetical protein